MLILDDERLVRMSVGARLRNTEFDLVGAETPGEAVDLLKRGQFRAVITDVMMGAVDGFMFRDLVRGFDKEIPLIFHTSLVGNADGDFFSRILEDENSHYLPKNSSTAALTARLRQVVGVYSIRAEKRARDAEVDRTLRLAALVQQSMLPEWAHEDKSFSLGVYWRPYARVSGDLYEIVPISDGSRILVFGDISGHGVSAALAMTAVQAFLRHFRELSPRRARNVAAIAGDIARFVHRSFAGLAYMSGLVMHVDPVDRVFRLCNAGHPDPICLTRAGERVDLNPSRLGCLPMGMLPDAEYDESQVAETPIAPGSVFIACSDGVTDLSSDPEGNDRVDPESFNQIACEAVRSLGTGAAAVVQAIPASIYSMLGDFGYVHPQDDAAIAAFSCDPPEENCFREAVRMDPAEIDSFCDRCGDFLRARKVLNSIVGRVELLCAEFLMNLHDHGYGEAERRHEIAMVRVSVLERDIEVSVWHRATSWEVPPENGDEALEKANDNLSPHGRGVPIIGKLSSAALQRSMAGLNLNIFYTPILVE